MTEQRKQEIINKLQSIINNFQPTENEPELTMFGLISRYNQQYDNPELIGGDWVTENAPEIANQVTQ